MYKHYNTVYFFITISHFIPEANVAETMDQFHASPLPYPKSETYCFIIAIRDIHII